jgi:hypothetical protein
MVKYVLPILTAAVLACSPKANYQSPTKDISRQEMSPLEIKSEEIGKGFMQLRDYLESKNVCKDINGGRECHDKFQLSPTLAFTKLMYSDNVIVFHAHSKLNGMQGIIQPKKGGEARPGILNKYVVEVSETSPPRHLYRKVIEDVVYLTEENNKIVESERKLIISCYDSLMQKLEVKDDECVPPKFSRIFEK